jgi:hypothetical protein
MKTIKSSLASFCESPNELTITVYAVTKDSVASPQKIDIEAAALDGLKALFLQNLKDAIIDRKDVSLLNLSSADERKNTIYIYDIDIPQEFLTMEQVLHVDSPPLLNLSAHSLLKIKALLIEIGNSDKQIVLYKTMAPVNIFGRASFFLVKSTTRMKQIDEEFLRVSPDFQLAHFDGKLLVLDLDLIEKSFGFRKIITKEALKGVAFITAKNLVENPGVLKELIGEVKYARRLTKIAISSPVILGNIENNKIISFCKTFPKLKGRIRFNNSEDKILLDTKVSKDLFIKLLMDDFLTSELTKYHYESLAKDSVETPEFAPTA